MVRDIAGLMEWGAFEQRRAYDQGVGFRQKWHSLILRPSILLRWPSPNCDIKTTAQFVVQRRRHRHFDMRLLGMKLFEQRYEPTQGKCRFVFATAPVSTQLRAVSP